MRPLLNLLRGKFYSYLQILLIPTKSNNETQARCIRRLAPSIGTILNKCKKRSEGGSLVVYKNLTAGKQVASTSGRDQHREESRAGGQHRAASLPHAHPSTTITHRIAELSP